MSGSKSTKRDRRSQKIRELFSEYISPILEVFEAEKKKKGEEFGASRVSGIIRDRVAFYIAVNYNQNFFMLREYFVPTKESYVAVSEFFKMNVPYSDVRQFYYQNKDKFHQLCDGYPEQRPGRRYIVRDQKNGGFVRIDEYGVSYVDQVFASAFDEFHNYDMTLEAVARLFLGYSYNPDYMHLKLIKVKDGKERCYHAPKV